MGLGKSVQALSGTPPRLRLVLKRFVVCDVRYWHSVVFCRPRYVLNAMAACAVPALYQHILVPMRCPVPRYGCLAYGIAYVMPGIDIVHNASAISSTDPAYDPTQALAAAALSDCWSLQTASALVAIRPTQRFRSLVGAEREIALCESFDLDTDAEGASVNLKCEKALTL
eukprot:148444-Rhodomonas_salina.2